MPTLKEKLVGKIKPALNENAMKVLSKRYLKKDREYYLYCSSGTRSRLLVNWLNKHGYHAINIIGGFHNYLLMK